jgi:hypothetical protein
MNISAPTENTGLGGCKIRTRVATGFKMSMISARSEEMPLAAEACHVMLIDYTCDRLKMPTSHQPMAALMPLIIVF